MEHKVIVTEVAEEDKATIVKMFNAEKVIWPWGLGVVWHRFWNNRGRTEHWDKAVLNGEIVGSVHWMMKTDNSRTIYDIVVRPDMRGKGIGAALVKAVGSPISLKTDSDAESNGFYRKLGFVPVGETLTATGKLVTSYYLEKEPSLIDFSKPWITTYTGRQVNPLDLKPEDIVIEDIAHALACANRFAGHLAKPVSVAQHSMVVSRLLEGTGHELQGLLHDAAEAYLGDMTKWVKESPGMEAYCAAEDKAQRAIYTRFGIPEADYLPHPKMMHPLVEEADRLMVRFEAEIGFGKAYVPPPSPRYALTTPEDQARIAKASPSGKWAALPWRAAEEQFLVRWRAVSRLTRSNDLAVGQG